MSECELDHVSGRVRLPRLSRPFAPATREQRVARRPCLTVRCRAGTLRTARSALRRNRQCEPPHSVRLISGLVEVSDYRDALGFPAWGPLPSWRARQEFARLLKPFFDSIDTRRISVVSGHRRLPDPGLRCIATEALRKRIDVPSSDKSSHTGRWSHDVELAFDLDRRRRFVLSYVRWVSTTYDFIEFAQVGDKRISLFNMMAKPLWQVLGPRICPFAGGSVRPLSQFFAVAQRVTQSLTSTTNQPANVRRLSVTLDEHSAPELLLLSGRTCRSLRCVGHFATRGVIQFTLARISVGLRWLCSHLMIRYNCRLWSSVRQLPPGRSWLRKRDPRPPFP